MYYNGNKMLNKFLFENCIFKLLLRTEPFHLLDMEKPGEFNSAIIDFITDK